MIHKVEAEHFRKRNVLVLDNFWKLFFLQFGAAIEGFVQCSILSILEKT